MKAKSLLEFKTYLDSPNELRVALGEFIKSHGIPPTNQYVKVLEYLLRCGGHPNAEDVYVALSPVLPELSRTRVHTILELFYQAKIINKIFIDEDIVYFDIDTQSNAHFACESCGEIFDVVSRMTSDQQDTDLPHLTEVQKVSVVYRGVCVNCAKGQSESLEKEE